MPLLAPLVDGGLTETQPYPIIIVNLIGSKNFIAKMVLYCANFFLEYYITVNTFTCLCKPKVLSSLLRLERYMFLIPNGLMVFMQTCTEAEWTTVCANYHLLLIKFTVLITNDHYILFYIVLILFHVMLIFIKHSLVQKNIS